MARTEAPRNLSGKGPATAGGTVVALECSPRAEAVTIALRVDANSSPGRAGPMECPRGRDDAGGRPLLRGGSARQPDDGRPGAGSPLRGLLPVAVAGAPGTAGLGRAGRTSGDRRA